jgi:hypothetical protein
MRLHFSSKVFPERWYDFFTSAAYECQSNDPQTAFAIFPSPATISSIL